MSINIKEHDPIDQAVAKEVRIELNYLEPTAELFTFIKAGIESGDLPESALVGRTVGGTVIISRAEALLPDDQVSELIQQRTQEVLQQFGPRLAKMYFDEQVAKETKELEDDIIMEQINNAGA